MKRVRYLGTGEAFDEALPNTSLLYEGSQRVLLDCGYSVPQALWRACPDPDFIDAIWLSHFHADHCFGLPAVLVRMAEDGRSRPLALMGGPGSAKAARRVLDVGYPGAAAKLGYALDHHEVVPGERHAFGELRLSCARSAHSVPNHAVRLDDGEISVCYSGDGAPTDQTAALYRGATLLVHETWRVTGAPMKHHATLDQVVTLAGSANVRTLHVLHLQRGSQCPPAVHRAHPGEVFEL